MHADRNAIEMLPQGDSCQCADCRAERGDTQFAEFMERVDAHTTKPKTIVEQLDAAETGEEFGQALMGLFDALERARDA